MTCTSIHLHTTHQSPSFTIFFQINNDSHCIIIIPDDGSKILSEITGMKVSNIITENNLLNEIDIRENTIPSLTDWVKRLCVDHSNKNFRRGVCRSIFKVLTNLFYIASDTIITEVEKNNQMKLFQNLFNAVMCCSNESYERKSLPLSLPLLDCIMSSPQNEKKNSTVIVLPSALSRTAFTTSFTTSMAGEQIYSLLASLLALRNAPRLIFPHPNPNLNGSNMNVEVSVSRLNLIQFHC